MHVDPTTLNYLDETTGFRRFVNWIQGAVALATVLGFISVITTATYEWSRYMPPLAMVVALSLSRWQLRYGPQRAVIVLVLGAWLMASATALRFSGVHTSVVTSFRFP